ncbi:MAG: fluoride efflux transporter CrcB [Bacteroidales bacterium]|nr:fluoride efflux transporter CrcB [Bacteroidales bacterium]
MLKNILYVMLGGSVGAALRYLVGVLCLHWRWTSLPWGTLLVNLIGCFLLGMLMGLGEKNTHFNPGLYLMLTVGLCGAFTTFSTFTADAFRMMNNGQWLMPMLYVCVSIVAGFLLFYVGRTLIGH